MAKATATCTCEKYGAKFEKWTIKNNRREADSWEEWATSHFTTCPACEEKEHAEYVEKLAAEAKENGMPELKGTAKQNAWAEQIRKEKIAGINSWLEACRPNSQPDAMAQAEETLAYVLTIDKSGWWIEHRDVSAAKILRECLPIMIEKRGATTASESSSSDAGSSSSSTVIVPENAKFGTATIAITDKSVEVRYPKDDTFREEIKKAGFSWNSDSRCWEKKLNFRTGSGVDRAADVANRLLSAGFSIDCANEEARKKAADGTFEPECKRWITCIASGEYEGWLAVSIPRRGEDEESQSLYDASRKIKGSHWYEGKTVVPAARYAEIEDFANIYSYRISDGAAERIEEEKNSTRISAVRPEKAESKDVLGDILNSSREVIDDLKDD